MHTVRTDWLKYPYYDLPDPGLGLDKPGVVKVPQPGGKFTEMASVEYTMAESISQDIRGFRKFLFAPELVDLCDRSPAAVRARLIEYAKSLTPYSYSPYIMAPGWDPVEAGNRYAKVLFELMRNVPVSTVAPDSNNVYDAWIDGTGQYYGGWAPEQR